MGQKVATPFAASTPPGQHVVHWDSQSATGAPVASGLYIYRLRTDSAELHRPMPPRALNHAPPEPSRLAAAHLLYDLERQAQPFDELLQALDARLPTNRDVRFARQLVLGVVRWQKRLDWIIATCCCRPVAQLSPWARHILRLGTYQLFWLDRVPQSAAVHTSVELAKHFDAPRHRLAGQRRTPQLAAAAYASVLSRSATKSGALPSSVSLPSRMVGPALDRSLGTRNHRTFARGQQPARPLNIYLNPLRAHREIAAELDLVPVESSTGLLSGD